MDLNGANKMYTNEAGGVVGANSQSVWIVTFCEA